MAGRNLRKRRRRVALIATALVLLVGGAGATGVFVVGSAQRRDDRAAYLAYERRALGPIRDGGRVVQEEMKPSLGELHAGQITAANAVDRAAGWRAELSLDRATLVAIGPPSFLGDIASRWAAAMDGYLRVPDLFVQAARASGAERDRLVTEAAAAGTHADNLFDDAASVMQYHRKRLGLGATPNLPNPSSTGS